MANEVITKQSFSPTKLLYISDFQDIAVNGISKRFGIKIVSNQDKPLGRIKRTRVNADTLTLNNRISKLWNNAGRYNVEVELEKGDIRIQLLVYNMLGKEMLSIFDGSQTQNKKIYTFDGGKLPNGIYICVLVGNSFRDTEKFIVSR